MNTILKVLLYIDIVLQYQNKCKYWNQCNMKPNTKNWLKTMQNCRLNSCWQFAVFLGPTSALLVVQLSWLRHSVLEVAQQLMSSQLSGWLLKPYSVTSLPSFCWLEARKDTGLYILHTQNHAHNHKELRTKEICTWWDEEKYLQI